MRRLLILLILLLAAPHLASAQFPSPTLAAVTVQNAATAGTLTVSGVANLDGGGKLIGTFTGGTILSNVTPTLPPLTIATLPGSGTPSTMYWASDCRNANETVGNGTGCRYHANDAGTLVPETFPPAGTVAVVGGQAITWGSATLNQGTGSTILTCTGSFVAGNAITTNASGACQDSGVVPSGGTGGGGTVANCTTAGAPSYYAVSGTTLTCPTVVNNSLWSSNGSGVLTAVTTLPSTLTAPTWTLSNANLTGAATYVGLTGSGTLSTAGSTVSGAGFVVLPGVAPTSPVNGAIWSTALGFLGHSATGGTVGPFIGLTQLSGSGAISYNNATGAFTCPLCLLGSGGGTLTVSAPLILSGLALSLGTTISPVELVWDGNTNVTAQTYPLPDSWPWATGTIDTLIAHTGGSSTPSFTVALTINGTPISGSCGTGVSISSSTDTTTSCGSVAITTGQKLAIVTSTITGTPNAAVIQINTHHSNP